jgi:hypothetical protein
MSDISRPRTSDGRAILEGDGKAIQLECTHKRKMGSQPGSSSIVQMTLANMGWQQMERPTINLFFL